MPQILGDITRGYREGYVDEPADLINAADIGM